MMPGGVKIEHSKERLVRSWKFWLGLLVSAFFLSIALRGLNLAQFWRTLREANYWWLLPGIGVYFIGVWIRTWRWRSMLNHIAPIPLRRLFPVVVIGYMGNNVYPARAGEVLRSYVLRRNEGVAMSASLATVVLERLFDGLVMLLFVFATLSFAPLPEAYRGLVFGFSGLFGLALLVFFVIAARPERLSRLYTLAVDRLVPARFRPRVHGLFDRFIIGLQSLRSPREMTTIFLTSTLIWLVETLKYWFVMHAFNFEVGFPVLMLMTAVVNLFTTIPSTPGYVGTFHYPGIAILTQFGVDQAIATGYTVVLHAALWLPITALGAWYMLRQSIGWKDMERAAAIAEAQEPTNDAAPPAAKIEADDVASGVTL
jgi:uncharacterized protein (TIRG00374 family)